MTFFVFSYFHLTTFFWMFLEGEFNFTMTFFHVQYVHNVNSQMVQ
jgi:hypothetical protein